MIRATRKDKSRVIEILVAAFQNDTHAHWMAAPKNRGFQKRLHALMNFAFEEGMAQGEIYLSHDKHAVAIWKTSKHTEWNLSLLKAYLDFGLTMGIGRVRRIMKMDKMMAKHHPAKEAFIYLWFIAVLPTHQGRGLSKALIVPMLDRAHAQKLEDYLETTSEQNVEFYGRRGFRVFSSSLLEGKEQVRLYFMRKELAGSKLTKLLDQNFKP